MWKPDADVNKNGMKSGMWCSLLSLKYEMLRMMGLASIVFGKKDVWRRKMDWLDMGEYDIYIVLLS